MGNKGKKDADFHVGSLVFAKVKGFAPWPAKVVRAEKKKYFVYFYGTGELSQGMKSEDLYDYTTHKAQFVVEKNLKRKLYPESVEQIEAALLGEEDVASINNTSATNESLNDDTTTTTNANETVEEEKQPVEVATKPEVKQVVKEKSPEPPVLEEKTALPKITEVKTPEPEIVSRSGRKIKSKRYLIDELDETVTPTIRKRAVDSSIDERKSIDDAAAPPVKKIKQEVKAVVPVVKKEAANPEKDMLLQIESHLIELDHLIKASVGLKNANADKCLEHLNEYTTLKITPLMLKKRPGVVQTMKRLRKYVGNASNWDMDESMRNEFNEKAQRIQIKAEEIYSSFKLLFPFNDQKSFWDHFSEKVAEFQQKIKGMTLDEINSMYEEPPTPPTSPLHHPNNGNTKSD